MPNFTWLGQAQRAACWRHLRNGLCSSSSPVGSSPRNTNLRITLSKIFVRSTQKHCSSVYRSVALHFQCAWKHVTCERQATLNYGSHYGHNALPLLICSEVIDVIVRAVKTLPYYEQPGWYMVTEGTVRSSFFGCVSILSLQPLYFFEARRNTRTWKQNSRELGLTVIWNNIIHRSVIYSSKYSD